MLEMSFGVMRIGKFKRYSCTNAVKQSKRPNYLCQNVSAWMKNILIHSNRFNSIIPNWEIKQ